MIEKILERLTAKKNEWLDNWRDASIVDDTEDCFYADGMSEAFLEAISIVQEVAKEYGNGWIPVETKLPKEGTPVLVCNKEGRVYIRQINWISRGRTEIPNWSQNSTGIIAWQPLPAPYQKGE